MHDKSNTHDTKVSYFNMYINSKIPTIHMMQICLPSLSFLFFFFFFWGGVLIQCNCFVTSTAASDLIVQCSRSSPVEIVSWCFKPSQPQRITPRLNTNFTPSPNYSFHKSSYYKSCFLAYLYSAGTQQGNLHSAGWPTFFCGPTQEPCVNNSQHRKNQMFWKKMQVNGPEG